MTSEPYTASPEKLKQLVADLRERDELCQDAAMVIEALLIYKSLAEEVIVKYLGADDE